MALHYSPPSTKFDDASHLEDCCLSEAVLAIERELLAAGIPGMIVGITDRSRLRRVLAYGHADLKASKPLIANSRLAIGSISKSFTAIAALQLAAEGRLDLHAPITRYLPDLALCSPFEPITAHHLVTHTSGLPGYLINVASSRYVIAALKDYVPSYAPGTHWWYSNTGYQLLGYILEDLEQLPYPTIIRRRILTPLGMNSTSAVLDDAERHQITASYIHWPYDDTYLEAPWFEYAAADGSLVSTISDMCAYARFMLNRGRGLNDRLLSEPDFLTLTTSVLDNYGYGLTVKQANGSTIVGHPGGIGGFRSLLEVNLDEGFGLVFLSTSEIDADLQTWIADAVAAGFTQTQLPAPLVRRAKRKKEVQDYAGIYNSADRTAPSGALEFGVVNGCLSLKAGSEFRALRRMGRDCFRTADSSDLPFFFGRASDEPDAPVVDVSHGAQWYVAKDFPGEIHATPPRNYSAYVGHFENVGPEGPVARVFVRNGRLCAAMSLSEELKPTILEPLSDGRFRMGDEVHSPERVQFDTIMNGKALRMTVSGVPLYRRDTP